MNVFREAGIYDACSEIAVKPDPNDPGKVISYSFDVSDTHKSVRISLHDENLRPKAEWV